MVRSVMTEPTTSPISLVTKLSDCGEGYGFAVVEDGEGNHHQALIDLNATDGTAEPRALILNDESRVTALGTPSEAFIEAYTQAPEATGNQRAILCYDLSRRLQGLMPEGGWRFPLPRLLDESRSRLTASFSGMSIAPKAGFGFVTDGKLLDLKSSFPHGMTRFVGGELTLDLDKLVQGIPAGRIGELAVAYMWGHGEESFDQNDLPLSNEPILPELQEALGVEPGEELTAKDLLKFNSHREANSHFVFVEWRWPSNVPIYQSHHWALVHPRFGIGAGFAYYDTLLDQGGTAEDGEGGMTSASDSERSKTFHAFVTGTTRVNLVEFRTRHIELALGGGVRVFAGMLFGMAGEGDLRFVWRFSNPLEF